MKSSNDVTKKPGPVTRRNRRHPEDCPICHPDQRPKRLKVAEQEKISTMSNLPWLEDVYMDCELTPDNLTPIVVGLNDLMGEGSFDLLDHVLVSLEVDKIQTGILVGILRITFMFKQQILWVDLLDRTRHVIDSRGEDSQRLLYGLI